MRKALGRCESLEPCLAAQIRLEIKDFRPDPQQLSGQCWLSRVVLVLVLALVLTSSLPASEFFHILCLLTPPLPKTFELHNARVWQHNELRVSGGELPNLHLEP